MTKKEYIEKLASIVLSAGADFMNLAQEDLDAMTDEQIADRGDQIIDEMTRRIEEMPTETVER